MRFEALLIHRCTLIGKGEVVGVDPYGRDIIEESKREDVPCKFDEIRFTNAPDDTGNDFIYENTIYFDQDARITLDTKIRDVMDKQGNLILPGSYTITRAIPLYGGDSLHHWEVTIQRE